MFGGDGKWTCLHFLRAEFEASARDLETVLKEITFVSQRFGLEFGAKAQCS